MLICAPCAAAPLRLGLPPLLLTLLLLLLALLLPAAFLLLTLLLLLLALLLPGSPLSLSLKPLISLSLILLPLLSLSLKPLSLSLILLPLLHLEILLRCLQLVLDAPRGQHLLHRHRLVCRLQLRKRLRQLVCGEVRVSELLVRLVVGKARFLEPKARLNDLFVLAGARQQIQTVLVERHLRF